MHQNDNGEIVMSRREYSQLMAAMPASHAVSNDDDDGWFPGLFGGDDGPGGPGFFTDVQYRHEDEVVIEDPEIVDFVGGALDVIRPNEYDEAVRIRVAGDVAVEGEDISPKSVTTESVDTDDAQITSASIDKASVTQYLETRARQVPIDINFQEQAQTAGDPLEPFNDFTRWGWSASEGSLSADTDITYRRMSQSARLVAGGSNNRSWIETSAFSTAKDFTGVDFSIVMRIDDVGGEVDLQLNLVDVNANKSRHRNKLSGAAAGQWERIDLSTQDGQTDTGFDRTAVDHIEIIQRNNEDCRIADLRTTDRPDTGVVMFRFDDAYETDYTNAAPILADYGFRGAFAVVPAYVGTSGRLTISQCQELSEMGHDVIAQSEDNFTNLTQSEQTDQIVETKQWMLDNGFDKGSRFWVTHQSSYTAHSLEETRKHFEMGFELNLGPYWGCNYRLTNPMMIRNANGDTFTDAKNAITSAGNHNRLMCLSFHDITDTTGFEDVISTAFDEVQNGNIEVITPSQYLSRLRGEYLP